MNVPLSDEQKIRILNSDHVYSVMQQILLRENTIRRSQEHFWVMGLDAKNKILFIELVSLGSLTKTIVEPPEVFRMAIYKLAVNIILIHNHPSGELEPSEPDLDITDRLIQVGKILKIEVFDHLIISEEAYFSFLNADLLEELDKNSQYKPPPSMLERIREEARALGEKEGYKKRTLELVKAMQQRGLEITLIAEITGLSLEEITSL
ncbi:MAG: JAB domain-containing protein [Bacteroidota bacterium]